MIPSSRKFPMRTDFMSFRSAASKFHLSHSTLYFSQNNLPHSRLSVVVPKKLNKSAVVRNWLKRITYDALWPFIKAGKMDCVVIFKPLPLTRNPANKKIIMDELNKMDKSGILINRQTG